jgi:branched-chain amino acid transport system substrate-binding protein
MRTNKLVGLVIVATVLLSVATVGWAQTPNKLDVGVATPLTGPAANVGSNFRNAVLMAAENQNAQGGVTIGGQKYTINVIVRDSKFDVTVAKTVAEELVFDKKVKAVFGASPVESASIQQITEPNKVLLFGMIPMPGLAAPDKPFSFWCSNHPLKTYSTGALYIKKYYPSTKRVATVYADIPDQKLWEATAKDVCSRFGFEWLGMEKYAATTTDFSAVIQRLLAKKPDAIDTAGSGGAMGAILPLLIKQIRQAGYEGVIWIPSTPPPGVMEEAVPKQYLNKIVTNDWEPTNPVVSKAYRDIYNQYVTNFKTKPIDAFGNDYNATKAFFEFLDGQKSMDLAAWVQGFEKYRWNGVYGHEEHWVGKPFFGINRFLIHSLWVSEWQDGKVANTQVVENFPYEWFVGK